MSLASRLPRPVSAGAASYPALIIASGAVDIAKVRREVRSRTRCASPFRWPAAAALADTFQKVRLQRAWAAKVAAEDAAIAERLAVEAAEIDAEAQAAIARHGSVGSLVYHLGRYEHGSLSLNHEAPHYRRVFRRAVEIACERAAASHLVAAE